MLSDCETLHFSAFVYASLTHVLCFLLVIRPIFQNCCLFCVFGFSLFYLFFPSLCVCHTPNFPCLCPVFHSHIYMHVYIFFLYLRLYIYVLFFSLSLSISLCPSFSPSPVHPPLYLNFLFRALSLSIYIYISLSLVLFPDFLMDVIVSIWLSLFLFFPFFSFLSFVLSPQRLTNCCIFTPCLSLSVCPRVSLFSLYAFPPLSLSSHFCWFPSFVFCLLFFSSPFPHFVKICFHCLLSGPLPSTFLSLSRLVGLEVQELDQIQLQKGKQRKVPSSIHMWNDVQILQSGLHQRGWWQII